MKNAVGGQAERMRYESKNARNARRLNAKADKFDGWLRRVLHEGPSRKAALRTAAKEMARFRKRHPRVAALWDEFPKLERKPRSGAESARCQLALAADYGLVEAEVRGTATDQADSLNYGMVVDAENVWYRAPPISEPPEPF